MEGLAVCLVMFLGNHWGYSFVDHVDCWSLPPDVEKTLPLFWYTDHMLFSSSARFSYTDWGKYFGDSVQGGWTHLCQKMHGSLPHKLSAGMSRRAPSSLFADPSVRCSPLSGWSGGSILILWLISVRNPAVMSLNSMWWIEGKPPWVQISACSTVKCWPQMQWDGRWEGGQPYCKQRASRNAPLWRANPVLECGKPSWCSLLWCNLHCPFHIAG